MNNGEVPEGKRRAEPAAGHRRQNEAGPAINVRGRIESVPCLVRTVKCRASYVMSQCFSLLICKMGMGRTIGNNQDWARREHSPKGSYHHWRDELS